MRFACALFRLALRAHPRAARRAFEAEAVEAFAAGLSVRRGAGLRAVWRYALAALLDAVASGMAARWRSVGPIRLGGIELRHELGHALRRLTAAPGFSLAVIALLALGVGANAAVFGALRHAVLAEPPFPGSERLVFPRVAVESPGERRLRGWSFPHFEELRASAGDAFDAMAAYAIRFSVWSEPGPAESLPFEFITPGYFELLGARPALGRFFAPGEEGIDAPPDVVVLAHSTWMQRFGGDTAAIGSSIVLDGRRLRVVGVAPAGFRGLGGRASFWVPVGQASPSMGNWTTRARDTHWLHAVARLRTGLAPERAALRLAPIVRDMEAVAPTTRPDETLAVSVERLGDIWTNPVTRRSLWLVSAGAALVLLVAIANIAGLLLARGRRYARDRAVRLALGASRVSLARQALLEALVLAVGGGVAALLVAHGALAGMRALWPAHLLRGAAGDVQSIDPASFALDPAIMALGLALAAAAALLAACVAVPGGGTLDVGRVLRRAPGGRATGSRADARSRALLVSTQAALSAVLLIRAGLLATTLHRLYAEQRGFHADRLLVLGYSLVGRPAMASQDGLHDFHLTLRDRVAGLPGVADVALGSSPPLAGGFMRTIVLRVAGRPPWPENGEPSIGIHVADAPWFETLGIRLLRGRAFSAAEERDASHLLVLSRTAAETLFPGEDPIGRQVRLSLATHDPAASWTVIGVVEDVLYGPAREGVQLEAYIPLGIWAPPAHTLFVRATTDPLALVDPVRETLASLDRAVPFHRVLTGDQLRTQGLADTRALAFLLVAFAILAVLLSAAGVWAVVAQAVAERRREIGVRVALGADGWSVERMILRQGLAPVVGGAATGLLIAAVGARQMSAFLFRTAPHDPRIYAAAALLVASAALLAGWVPARRASRVDPVQALAGE